MVRKWWRLRSALLPFLDLFVWVGGERVEVGMDGGQAWEGCFGKRSASTICMAKLKAPPLPAPYYKGWKGESHWVAPAPGDHSNLTSSLCCSLPLLYKAPLKSQGRGGVGAGGCFLTWPHNLSLGVSHTIELVWRWHHRGRALTSGLSSLGLIIICRAQVTYRGINGGRLAGRVSTTCYCTLCFSFFSTPISDSLSEVYRQ